MFDDEAGALPVLSVAIPRRDDDKCGTEDAAREWWYGLERDDVTMPRERTPLEKALGPELTVLPRPMKPTLVAARAVANAETEEPSMAR